MINGHTDIIAHIGYPTHTFKSPMIYNPYFRQAGINTVVVPMACQAAHFAPFLKAIFTLENTRGALITMPHKVAVVGLLDDVSAAVRVAGACNAVRRAADGRPDGRRAPSGGSRARAALGSPAPRTPAAPCGPSARSRRPATPGAGATGRTRDPPSRRREPPPRRERPPGRVERPIPGHATGHRRPRRPGGAVRRCGAGRRAGPSGKAPCRKCAIRSGGRQRGTLRLPKGCVA